jgi:FtsP/CotA-like multicopper oxidase with cupredoxin domain
VAVRLIVLSTRRDDDTMTERFMCATPAARGAAPMQCDGRRLARKFHYCTALAFAVLLPMVSHAATLCPRPLAGSVVQPPADLYSSHGVLRVKFDYFTSVDESGRTLFCFMTPSGQQSPTLHVRPGDELNVTVTNRVPAPPSGSPTEVVSNSADKCRDETETITSMNIHYHGTNTSPQCHGDEVIHTIINSGETFQYSLKFPKSEPPGLYWYHPHVHGLSEGAVLGGGSGAIVVEGIGAFVPKAAGLPERVLIVRDQNTIGFQTESASGGSVPGWDVSLNYVPTNYNAKTNSYTPAIIEMAPNRKELWRVANSSADTVLDLQLRYDGVAQPLELIGLDGVPTGSQDGTRMGKPVSKTDILIPPAGRAEFIATGPGAYVKTASFLTLNVDTGPDGDNDPTRPLATIRKVNHEPLLATEGPDTAWDQLYEGLLRAPVTAKRKLYFSEVLSDPSNPASPTNFFITVDGATPALFDANNPPAITTTQGAVEEWTIENRAGEVHEFHMHQIHFLLLKQNGEAVPEQDQQMRDTVQVPYWSGSGPYPSVTVRMDFRGPVVGDFVYHCHILGHEDNGMMAIIRVKPAPHDRDWIPNMGR